MPKFQEDPSLLTKDKLKSELLANDVPLPAGEQKKDVYVQLYKQHLTARNRPTPDFSSDEDRESTPIRGRGRPPGRKATKKTDKPSVEEKIEQDVTELSNEALRDELLKYGITPGPIMGSTRKVYEKRLLKVKEQQVTSVTSLGDASNVDTKQNGNSDSAQYSDNDEPKVDLTFETREPIRGKSKTQVASRSRRLEQNESISGDDLSEPTKMVEPEKVGRVQAILKETSRVARRTPRKRVVASEPVPDDEPDVTETPAVTETILPSSNQAPVENQVTEIFKHTNALRAVSEFSEFSRRTPKKQPISEKMVEKTYIEERREDRDILKSMFPYESSTPTGISATCRRPIKGAAGRPLSLKDYKIEESYTTKYVSKYQPVLAEKTTNPKTARSIPMWIKILLFVVFAVFLFLVYQVMETNEGNPFSRFLSGESVGKTKN